MATAEILGATLVLGEGLEVTRVLDGRAGIPTARVTGDLLVAVKNAQGGVGSDQSERASHEDFAKLAREYSDDAATRKDGGDLGYFGKDILPKPIEELVFSMNVGEVAGPVRADHGFHVIKLVDRKTVAAKPLGEVEDEIRMQLRQREMDKQTKAFLADLRKKNLVDIRY